MKAKGLKAAEKECEAKTILEEHGFRNVRKPTDNIGDWVGEKDEQTFVVEVKTRFSRKKTTFRKGVKIGLHQSLRQQNRMLQSEKKPLFLVYFGKIKRWVFASGYSSKIKPTDKSLY